MDFITGKHISRREVLRGMGAAVARPFLDAMVPAGRSRAAGATVATEQTRLVAIEMVHGAAGSNEYGASQNLWSPATVGRDFDLSSGGAELARALPGLSHHHQQHRCSGGGGDHGTRDRRRPLPFQRRFLDAVPPQTDRGL